MMNNNPNVIDDVKGGTVTHMLLFRLGTHLRSFFGMFFDIHLNSLIWKILVIIICSHS